MSSKPTPRAVKTLQRNDRVVLDDDETIGIVEDITTEKRLVTSEVDVTFITYTLEGTKFKGYRKSSPFDGDDKVKVHPRKIKAPAPVRKLQKTVKGWFGL